MTARDTSFLAAMLDRAETELANLRHARDSGKAPQSGLLDDRIDAKQRQVASLARQLEEAATQ